MNLAARIDRFRAQDRLARAGTLAQALAFAGLAAAALYVAADKLLCLPLPYTLVGGALASAGLAALLVFWLAARTPPLAVTYRIDRAAGLHNLVTSGLAASAGTDEVSRVVAARAAAALAQCRPGRVLPLRLHWSGRYAALPLLALIAALFVPPRDLLGRRCAQTQLASERAAVRKGALQLAASLVALEGQPTVLQSVQQQELARDLTALTSNLVGTAKTEALQKLGEFENKHRDALLETRNLEQAARNLQAPQDASGLAPDTADRLRKLADGLRGGDFKQAGDALRDLAQQLAGKQLSPAEKKALARELAKALDRLPAEGGNRELADLLRQLAASPESAEKLGEACQSCSAKMGDAASRLDQCEALKAIRDGLAEAKKEIVGDTFRDFDARQVEQAMAAEAGLGTGEGQCEGTGGKGKGSGNGTGGEGKGRGGQPPEAPSDTGFKSTLAPAKTQKGKMLQDLLVSGVPDKGEAPAAYADVVKAARQEAAGALSKDQVPVEYETMVKTYFDSLEPKREKDSGAPIDDAKPIRP